MNSKGVTLIELVVVLAIFILIFGAATSVLLSMIQHERVILVQAQALNQASYMQDFMSRALRMAKSAKSSEDLNCMEGHTGYAYLLTRYDSTLKSFKGIKFINQQDNNTCEEFFLDTGDAQNPVLKVLKNSTQDADALELSSSNLNIVSVKFAINGLDGGVNQLSFCGDDITACGASQADGIQPRVTLLLQFTFKGNPAPSRFLQTTVSQMNVN